MSKSFGLKPDKLAATVNFSLPALTLKDLFSSVITKLSSYLPIKKPEFLFSLSPYTSWTQELEKDFPYTYILNWNPRNTLASPQQESMYIHPNCNAQWMREKSAVWHSGLFLLSKNLVIPLYIAVQDFELWTAHRVIIHRNINRMCWFNYPSNP